MAAAAPPIPKLDRYVVIHVATTCDEHGVYVTKDSAEVIEIGWILLDSKTCDEVCGVLPNTGMVDKENQEARLVLTNVDLSRERARQAGQYPYYAFVQ